jgi:hypothetical protein
MNFIKHLILIPLVLVLYTCSKKTEKAPALPGPEKAAPEKLLLSRIKGIDSLICPLVNDSSIHYHFKKEEFLSLIEETRAGLSGCMEEKKATFRLIPDSALAKDYTFPEGSELITLKVVFREDTTGSRDTVLVVGMMNGPARGTANIYKLRQKAEFLFVAEEVGISIY